MSISFKMCMREGRGREVKKRARGREKEKEWKYGIRRKGSEKVRDKLRWIIKNW